MCEGSFKCLEVASDEGGFTYLKVAPHIWMWLRMKLDSNI